MAPRAHVVPTWLRHYERTSWRFDVVAGLTVTAILVPEGMAYAQLAGVDPQAAFYAAPAALLLYALLGSSRQLVVAVSSAVAITSAATISELAPQGSLEYVALTAALALLAGLERLRAVGSSLWVATNVDLVRRRLVDAGVAEEAQLFRDVSGAQLTYLSLHSSRPGTGRLVVLHDLLDVIERRRGDPRLDDSGRRVLDEIEERLRGEVHGD